MTAPVGTISVREPGRNAGGGVVDAYYPSGSPTLDGRGSVVIFVHGYNNSRDAAEQSYATFIADLETATGRSPLPWTIFGVQWPGDESNAIIGAALYGQKIGVAQKAAERIVDLLAASFGPGGAPIILSFVGHSLGCRLILDQLRLLSDKWPDINVVIDRVALMAAAVPVDRCKHGGSLRDGIDFANGVDVLWSRGDNVLHWAFPIGQTAGGDGFFPTAVGRNGDPTDAWRQRREMSGDKGAYGHSDYWPGAGSASDVASFLRQPVAAEPLAAGFVSHELPPPNMIAERVTSSREV